MNKTDHYRQILQTFETKKEWKSYLLQESRLPGPRANLELAQAAAEEGDQALFLEFLSFDHESAPANTPGEFLTVCGVLGLGRLLSEGQMERWETLRQCAGDPRWRIREAVALALQRFGAVDMEALIDEMEYWSEGDPFEQRAAAAALCEPRLLQEKEHVFRVLQILDRITAHIQHIENRRSEAFKALRKGLGYCWSVAVVALPGVGKQMMERWFASQDSDILWIMKQNLRKKRLSRMDLEWVKTSQEQLRM